MQVHTNRRALVTAAAALALACVGRSASAAGVPVVDMSRWTAMKSVLDQATSMLNQLQAGANLLQDASARLPRSISSFDDILLGMRRLTSDVDAIGYRMETVTRQFKRMFPDKEAVQDIQPREMNTLQEGWDQEIHMASLTAARSQTTLSTIDTNTRSAKDVLERSSNQKSAVAQLQAMVKMIEIINSDLANLATTISASERVNSTLAVTEVSSREVAAERRRRLLKAYDTRPDSQGIDDQFLRVPGEG
jgi:type IV secretion system protein TrbJ